MHRFFAGLGVTLLLFACGSGTQEPPLFLPRVIGPDGTDIESRRQQYCQGGRVSLQGDVLTPQNFQNIFDCANYDYSLEELKPLLTSPLFPDFLGTLNLVLGSRSTQSLKQTLEDWFAEASDGRSRLDRLLPDAAQVIRSQAFQEGLPLLSAFLQKGKGVWEKLLPNLADLVFQERFPDNWDDLTLLVNGDRAGAAANLKRWAALLADDVGGQTVARRAVGLAYRLREIELDGTSLPEYLDHLNEKGVFDTLYLDNGAVRGEVLDPKLNADPDEDELRDGTPRTPFQRQAAAYQALFRTPAHGQAPIVQLAGLVAEFHEPHPDFLPALSRWFSANGERIEKVASEYVVRARVVEGLARLKPEPALLAFAKAKGMSAQAPVSREAFTAFLVEALASPDFSAWLAAQVHGINQEQLGPRNAEFLAATTLHRDLASAYADPALAAAGGRIVPEGGTLALAAAVKRFSNLHRGYKLAGSETFEARMLALWWHSVQAGLGESLALGYVLKLAQTLLAQYAADFSQNGLSISEWYFSSPYGNPATTEALVGYAVKEFDLLAKWREHREYLKEKFAEEVFSQPEDRRAFRYLVDQVPNLWIYIKSGMSRSGNDLNRAMASRDRGFLIRRYVDLVASAHQSGWLADGVRLVEAYQRRFPMAEPALVDDSLAERRRISKGADALKRLARSLFEPAVTGDYTSSALGRFLVPAAALVEPAQQNQTERFLLASAREVSKMSEEKLSEFFGAIGQRRPGEALVDRRAKLQSAAELLRDPNFPRAVEQVCHFFREDAVKPALDFFVRKMDDGSLPRALLLLRRVMGFARP